MVNAIGHADFGAMTMPEEPKKPKPKTVDLVKSDYQPTKAELDDEFDPTFPEMQWRSRCTGLASLLPRRSTSAGSTGFGTDGDGGC